MLNQDRKIDIKQLILSGAIILVVAAQGYFCFSYQDEVNSLKQANSRLQSEINSLNLRSSDGAQAIARLEEEIKGRTSDADACIAELQAEKQKKEVKTVEPKPVKPIVKG